MRAITSGGTPATLQSSACCSTPACFTPIISPESQSLDNISKSFQEPLSFQCPRGISILVPPLRFRLRSADSLDDDDAELSLDVSDSELESELESLDDSDSDSESELESLDE